MQTYILSHVVHSVHLLPRLAHPYWRGLCEIVRDERRVSAPHSLQYGAVSAPHGRRRQGKSWGLGGEHRGTLCCSSSGDAQTQDRWDLVLLKHRTAGNLKTLKYRIHLGIWGGSKTWKLCIWEGSNTWQLCICCNMGQPGILGQLRIWWRSNKGRPKNWGGSNIDSWRSGEAQLPDSWGSRDAKFPDWRGYPMY